MNRKFFAAISLMVLFLLTQCLTGCATVTGPREVRVPLDKLQSSLAQKFPIKQRYLALVDVTVSNPRINVSPESNRMLATVDAEISPLGMAGNLNGSFTLSGLPAIDAQRRVLVLRGARMEKLTFDGADTALASQLARISDLLALNTLGDIPLYTFDPEQFRYGGTQFFPTKITATTQGIVVTFEPVK